jgi:hypothetical protein
MTPIHVIGSTTAFDIPEGATNFGWQAGMFCCKLPGQPTGTWHWLTEIDDWMRWQRGEYEVICTTKEAKAYHAPELFGYAMIGDQEAIDTLNALLASKGLDPNKNYVIIKKVS